MWDRSSRLGTGSNSLCHIQIVLHRGFQHAIDLWVPRRSPCQHQFGRAVGIGFSSSRGGEQKCYKWKHNTTYCYYQHRFHQNYHNRMDPILSQRTTRLATSQTSRTSSRNNRDRVGFVLQCTASETGSFGTTVIIVIMRRIPKGIDRRTSLRHSISARDLCMSSQEIRCC